MYSIYRHKNRYEIYHKPFTSGLHHELANAIKYFIKYPITVVYEQKYLTTTGVVYELVATVDTLDDLYIYYPELFI